MIWFGVTDPALGPEAQLREKELPQNNRPHARDLDEWVSVALADSMEEDFLP